MAEVKDPKIEADGSISVLLDGKTVKLVKESDLLAVKGGAEKREAELLGIAAEANRIKDEAHQSLLKQQALYSELETKAKDVPVLQQKLQEMTKNFDGLKAENSLLSGRVLEHSKQNLVLYYGVKEDNLKDLPLQEVVKMEEAFVKAGVPKRGVIPYDTGSHQAAGSKDGYKNLAERKAELNKK